MTTLDLISYYANLLILQYVGKTRAFDTIKAIVTNVVMPTTSIQTIVFSGIAANGNFKLNYGGVDTSSLAWNASVNTIQSALQAITGLGSITVTGSIASQLLIVTFTDVTPPAALLTVSADALLDGSSKAVSLTVDEIDDTLPIAVQNAFNIDTAVGVQLDILGKYVGGFRTGNTFNGPVTLSDSDFRTLIRIKILQNNAGSSLQDIQNLLYKYFPGKLLVFDYANMSMSYFMDASAGSLDLAEILVTSKALPKPMGVQLAALIYALDIAHFFGFRSYELPPANIEPFNTYQSYNTTWPWLDYADAVVV